MPEPLSVGFIMISLFDCNSCRAVCSSLLRLEYFGMSGEHWMARSCKSSQVWSRCLLAPLFGVHRLLWMRGGSDEVSGGWFWSWKWSFSLSVRMNLRTSVSKSMLLKRPGVGEKLRPLPNRVVWASVR